MKERWSILLVLFILSTISAKELPQPSYENSIIISIEYNLKYATPYEINYIKNSIGEGLYAWLCFSKTTLVPDLDWHYYPSNAYFGIRNFREEVEEYIAKAKEYNVRIHIALCAGLARGLSV